MTLNSDIEGAVRVAQAAKAFTWTWGDDDVEQFRSILGWEILRRHDETCTLATDLQVNIARAHVDCDKYLLRKYGGDRESIVEMSVYVTDTVSNHLEPLRELFDQFSARLIRELGEPDALIAGEKVEWSTPTAIVGLGLSTMRIDLDVVNPRYRKWDADCEWYEDRAEVDRMGE